MMIPPAEKGVSSCAPERPSGETAGVGVGVGVACCGG